MSEATFRWLPRPAPMQNERKKQEYKPMTPTALVARTAAVRPNRAMP
jgi:hypothetical protein